MRLKFVPSRDNTAACSTAGVGDDGQGSGANGVADAWGGGDSAGTSPMQQTAIIVVKPARLPLTQVRKLRPL